MDIENTNKTFKALIVDDETIVCQTLEFALSREGFQCDIVKDGQSAQKKSEINKYDLIVTDLRMPEQNGHALTVSLLAEQAPPVIIVHTSVEDTNIIKDLIVRGVDDVIQKPTNYEIFSSKARKLVEQRRKFDRTDEAEIQPALTAPSNHTKVEPLSPKTVTAEDVNEKLQSLESFLPVSDSPFVVYSLCSHESVNIEQLAQIIIEDGSMVAPILEAANRSYSSPLERVTKVVIQKSIVKLGRRKIGEIALWVGIQRVFGEFDVPWIDSELLWKKSVTSAAATEVLSERMDSESGENPEYLCALLYPVGRLVLASLYPEIHCELTERCKQTGDSLDLAEIEAFGLSSGQVMAKCLSKWQISFKILMPLEYINKTDSELLEFPTSLRTRIEKMKLAILFSQIAFSLWEPHDQIEIPSEELLKELELSSVSSILSAIKKKCVDQVPIFKPDENNQESLTAIKKSQKVCYFSRLSPKNDTLYQFLISAGIPVEVGSKGASLPLLLNNLVDDNATREMLLKEQEERACYGVVSAYKNSSLYSKGMSISNPFTIQQIVSFIKSTRRHFTNF